MGKGAGERKITERFSCSVTHLARTGQGGKLQRYSLGAGEFGQVSREPIYQGKETLAELI